MIFSATCRFAPAGIFILAAAVASGEPVTYEIDPRHTFPAFEADHMGGLSIWRGKINRTSGSIVLDREAETGSVEVIMDMASIDFGLEEMNEHARNPDIFDVGRYPTARYTGQLADFEDGAPTAVEGTLTLHGVTRPLTLAINRFLCKPHPASGREVCGADASAQFERDDFGVSYGQAVGFDMGVRLLISVEAEIAE